MFFPVLMQKNAQNTENPEGRQVPGAGDSRGGQVAQVPDGAEFPK